MRRIGLIVSLIIFSSFFYLTAQTVADMLTSQGAWFLHSLKTEEQVDEEKLIQIEYFKKDDISSIYFDTDNKLYTVFSKYSTDVFEDRWKLVDDTHYVMVSPIDESSQIVEILEISKDKLVLRNCGDIENGTSCTLYTYLASRNGWLEDAKIEELNKAGIIQQEDPVP